MKKLLKLGTFFLTAVFLILGCSVEGEKIDSISLTTTSGLDLNFVNVTKYYISADENEIRIFYAGGNFKLDWNKIQSICINKE